MCISFLYRRDPMAVRYVAVCMWVSILIMGIPFLYRRDRRPRRSVKDNIQTEVIICKLKVT